MKTDLSLGLTRLRIRAAPLLLLCLGIAFVAFGAWRGETNTVFAKAVRLCLECVGIG